MDANPVPRDERRALRAMHARSVPVRTGLRPKANRSTHEKHTSTTTKSERNDTEQPTKRGKRRDVAVPPVEAPRPSITASLTRIDAKFPVLHPAQGSVRTSFCRWKCFTTLPVRCLPQVRVKIDQPRRTTERNRFEESSNDRWCLVDASLTFEGTRRRILEHEMPPRYQQ